MTAKKRSSRKSRPRGGGYEVHRQTSKAYRVVSTHRAKRAAIDAAEALARKATRPVKVYPNGVREFARFAVYDPRGVMIGSASPPEGFFVRRMI